MSNAPAVPMTKVEKSSNIAAFGYDPASKVMAVQFSTGKTYHYTDVPADVAEGMAQAESKGSFFARNVRGQFSGALLEEPAST